jgi:sugar lactone lactonase YvrE
MSECVCVVDAGAELGEGTVWDPEGQVLWWLDIWGRRIHCYDPKVDENHTWETPEPPGCLGVREGGGLVISMGSGFYFFDPEPGAFTPIVLPEAGRPEIRFNDGRVDRQGRFWSGSMFEDPGRPIEFAGSLFRLDADLTVHRVEKGIGCSNGLAWSPDSRVMYFADSHAHLVWAYDFDVATGTVANRRIFIDLRDSRAIADGATVDAEGCYWLTIPHTFKVSRFDPDGRLMRDIVLPTEAPTCCEFGGPDLDILYVTTGARGLRHQPYAGGLFAVDAGVRGLPAAQFQG